MQIPTIPTNETDRQVALDRYQILDTLPEQEYDDLTQIAADICGTPIALISLIDRDRQWFKAKIGIETSETSRDLSFCGHVVANNAILTVPDATQDSRFADNPFVVNDPKIRFYTGIPLKTPDNFTLGTLCVIDREPRHLTPLQIERLTALSRLIISQLELRHSNAIRKTSEAQLSKALMFQQAIFNSINFAVIATDLQGTIQSFNAGAEAMLGYQATEILGRKSTIFHDHHEINQRSQQLSAELNQPIGSEFDVLVAKARLGQVIEQEWTYIRKNGDRLPVLISIVAMQSDHNEITGFLIVAQDITERKKAAKQLKDITDALDRTAIVAITDIQGTITFVNDKFCEISQYHRDELIGQNHHILNSGYHPREFFREMWQEISQGHIWRAEIKNRTKNGSFYWVDTTIVPFLNDHGKPYQYLAIRTDITPLKETENELRIEVKERLKALTELHSLTERLETSNRELQDFAHVASHDLQEPLRKVQAFGDRLKSTCEGSLSDKAQDYLARMLNAASRAQILIDDLLVFSRVTTQAKPFEPVNLSVILQEVLSDLEIRLEKTGAMIECDPLPVIDADALQMRQILQNLLSNALKFHKNSVQPFIQVRSRIYHSDNQDWCEVRIIDNGIGFEEKYVERIFQIFQRLYGRKDYEGTGIGLAICRKIVERHGGTITAQSQLDQGSVFIFTIPIHQTVRVR
ncbi:MULTISPECIES: GAF domain-containing sensor histidine kinase [Pseudanabaena]|uniref:histidine kinase n=2 Tax=Pseudanabaena TaxID=1152 RepID=L8MWG2_9CYAN|nr:MULTISPECIES: PAS domain S-box protein [Pseudanabaena]ELS30780.1 multi-sensor signal transduction histidine kinase [Pseudanabaena biceps PCC 7429]MDG3496948.1 PAS domain S-box protein [Pseudanabaena catenata USMAC16]